MVRCRKLLPVLGFLLLSQAGVSDKSMAGPSRRHQPTPVAKARTALPVGDVQVKQPNPTPPVGTDYGWRLIYAEGPGQATMGSRERLAEMLKKGTEVGVSFESFHGHISGICQNPNVSKAGQLECDIEVWCNQANEALIPDRHGHKAHVRSDGYISFVVIVHNERGEDKILALGDSDATVAWYVR